MIIHVHSFQLSHKQVRDLYDLRHQWRSWNASAPDARHWALRGPSTYWAAPGSWRPKVRQGKNDQKIWCSDNFFLVHGLTILFYHMFCALFFTFYLLLKRRDWKPSILQPYIDVANTMTFLRGQVAQRGSTSIPSSFKADWHSETDLISKSLGQPAVPGDFYRPPGF